MPAPHSHDSRSASNGQLRRLAHCKNRPQLAAMAALLCAFGSGRALLAQSQPLPPTPEYGDELYYLHKAWVDPVHGINGSTKSERLGQIDDPSQAFESLQVAIDTMYDFVAGEYVSNPPES